MRSISIVVVSVMMAGLPVCSCAAEGTQTPEVVTPIAGWQGVHDTKDVHQTPDGHIDGTITGTDSQILSSKTLNIDLDAAKVIKIVYRNGSAGKRAKIYFITTSELDWDEAKSKSFEVKANDADYSEYTLAMSTVTGWTGTLEQLRFDPVDEGAATGTFSIARIQLVGTPPLPPRPPAPEVPRSVVVGDLMREWFGHMATYLVKKQMLSGWELDPPNLKFEYGYHSWFKIIDADPQKSMCLRKRFVAQRSGQFSWEFKFQLPVIADGPCWSLCQDNDPVVHLFISGGKLCVWDRDRKVIPLTSVTANKDCGVRVNVDMDGQTFIIQVDGKTFNIPLPFAKKADALNFVSFQTGKEYTGELFTCPILIEKGFALHERFLSAPIDTVPDNWVTTTKGGTVSIQRPGGSGHGQDANSLKLEETSLTDAVSAGNSFPPLAGKVKATFKVLIPKTVDGMRMELIGTKDKPIITITTANGNLSYLNAEGIPQALRKDYKPTVWYELTTILDCAAGKADIFVNTVIAAKGISLQYGKEGVTGVRFSTSGTAIGVLWVDDVAVCPHLDYPTDYVPEPKVVQTGSYLIGVQSCDLWREGTHLGWEWIKRYRKLKPLLGWYNGGDPEMEDWTIKWMVENGIAFDFKCWYRGERGYPLHSTQQAEGLEGYRWARYSDRMHFAINLTNHFDMFKDLQDWKENVVPYLLENLFCDPRYMKIDNKPVLGIYDPNWLQRNVGDVKSALNYLREECKKAGFAGVYLLAQHRFNEGRAMSQFKDWGFDSIYAYTWTASNAQAQEKSLVMHRDKKSIDVLPTLSMGWDTRGWEGPQGYWLNKNEFKSLLQWAKDTFMAAAPADALSHRIAMLDNWNEFGEGHFMMPSILEGFGYVNAVREVFGQEPFPPNVEPTSAQKARLDTLFPHGDW